MVIQRIKKPKTKRGKRFLETRDAKVIENTKKAMFVNGGRTNDTVRNALKQFYLLKKPDSVLLAQKHIMRPFDDPTKLEFLSQKFDNSLFMFGSHSKKRPNNLIIGRMFDYHILDMFEFSIDNMVQMEAFKTPKITIGTKPCLLFVGEAFDTDPQYARMKCLFTDFFRGEVVEKIRPQGMEYVIAFYTVDAKIHIRCYRITLKKGETKTPNVELDEMGPSFDLTVRRNRMASDDLYKKSKKQPKELTSKKPKNISYDGFGSKLGRLHMQKQDLNKLQTRKIKGLKRKADDQENGDNSKIAKNDSNEVNSQNVELNQVNE